VNALPDVTLLAVDTANHALALRAEKYRIGIHASRQRSRLADIRVDEYEFGFARFRFVHRRGC